MRFKFASLYKNSAIESDPENPPK
uniref:Uncharacterized protein n=1 Tax=Rhizophora mucronata TaxID=61149 RepID=A0A2P2M801_RHIMU